MLLLNLLLRFPFPCLSLKRWAEAVPPEALEPQRPVGLYNSWAAPTPSWIGILPRASATALGASALTYRLWRLHPESVQVMSRRRLAWGISIRRSNEWVSLPSKKILYYYCCCLFLRSPVCLRFKKGNQPTWGGREWRQGEDYMQWGVHIQVSCRVPRASQKRCAFR